MAKSSKDTPPIKSSLFVITIKARRTHCVLMDDRKDARNFRSWNDWSVGGCVLKRRRTQAGSDLITRKCCIAIPFYFLVSNGDKTLLRITYDAGIIKIDYNRKQNHVSLCGHTCKREREREKEPVLLVSNAACSHGRCVRTCVFVCVRARLAHRLYV